MVTLACPRADRRGPAGGYPVRSVERGSHTLEACSDSRMRYVDVSSTWTVSSPRPPRCTTPRGRRCSTASCASGRGRPARRSCRSTRSRTTTSMSTASPGPTGPAPSWRPAASSCRRAARTILRAHRLSTASVTARTRSCCGGSGRTGWKRTRARSDMSGRPGTRGCAAPWCRPAPTATTSSSRRASRTCSRRGSTVWSPSGSARPRAEPPARGGLRGRGGGRGGGAGGRVRLCGGGGPRRAGRGAESPRGRHRRGRSRRVAGPAVIRQAAFTVEPWSLREATLDLDLLAQTESVFALSNGHLGWRANLDEGEPHALPGSYLNGVYEVRPLPYAEAQYGLPESGQTVINVTDGKLIRLFVDDEPFDVRYGDLLAHERLLDFRAGVLSRRAEWVSPAGRTIRVSSSRLVSFTQRAIGAISYEVEPLDGPARIAVQSELLANEQLPPPGGDPRVAVVLENPLVSEYYAADGTLVVLVHKTRQSGLRVGTSMDHVIDGPADTQIESRAFVDGGVVTATTVLQPGQRLRVIKFVAYGWSGARSLQGVRDQVWAALSAARQSGWDGLLAEQRAYLDDFWDRADVEVDGDTEVQQAVRFALFHVLQAGARSENRPIPTKGLTGPGYD